MAKNLADVTVEVCAIVKNYDVPDAEVGRLYTNAPSNTIPGGGRNGMTKYQPADGTSPWKYGVILPNEPALNGNVHFVAMQKPSDSENVAVFVGYTDGRLLYGIWDGQTGRYTNKSFGCMTRRDATWAPQVSYINTAFPAARLTTQAARVPDPVPSAPPSSVPGQSPQAGPPPTFDGSGDLPGTFGAGITGLPSKPGWFKTPAGFCRKWEPWERAILKIAQEKNKKDMEAYLESVNCQKPRRACKYTSCY